MSEQGREDVVRAARRMLDVGLVVGTAGNVSARDGNGFLITPTRQEYSGLRPDQLVTIRMDANEPPPGASLEWRMHQAIYRARSDVRAIVHTHSAYATAWGFDQRTLPPLEDVRYFALGEIRTAPPLAGGSVELAQATVTTLGSARAALLSRHGVVTVGSSAREALTIAEVVEHVARVGWLLRQGAPPPCSVTVSQ